MMADQRIRIKYIPILLAFSILLAGALPVFGHEVLPQEYLDFIKEKPNFAPEDFQIFLNQNPVLKNDQDFLNHVYTARDASLSFLDNMREFIRIGILHILKGTDHVLFVLSLVLVYTTLRRELWLLSAFTVAHSISLLLAGTGILTLSRNIVEPVVALSITYMALTSVFLSNFRIFRGLENKASTVFVFGLFHGLGFAGLMKDIKIPQDKFISSLLSFNIGIEIGQFVILAMVLPLIYYFKEKSWYPKVVKGVAVIISIIGLFWGMQRIFG